MIKRFLMYGKHILKIAALMLGASLFAYSPNSISDMKEKESHKRGGRFGNVTIGVTWSGKMEGLYNGTLLAVEEINKRGGVLGRPLKIKFRDDEGKLEKAKSIAEEFGRDNRVVAVVGCAYSELAVPASIIYEKYRLPLITPAATTPEYARSDFRYIFRNILNDYELMKTGIPKIAQYLKTSQVNGRTNCVVLHDDSRYGKGLAYSFQIFAEQNDIYVIKSFVYRNDKPYFSKIIRELKDLEFDCIMYAGLLPGGAEFIKQLRGEGIDKLVISGDSLDSPELVQVAGKFADNILILTHLNPMSEEKELKEFRVKYMSNFSSPPDMFSDLGYDAVNLIGDVYDAVGMFNSAKFADKIHLLYGWKGVTGVHNFDEKGNVTGKPAKLKYYAGGKARFLEDKKEGEVAQ